MEYGKFQIMQSLCKFKDEKDSNSAFKVNYNNFRMGEYEKRRTDRTQGGRQGGQTWNHQRQSNGVVPTAPISLGARTPRRQLSAPGPPFLRLRPCRWIAPPLSELGQLMKASTGANCHMNGT